MNLCSTGSHPKNLPLTTKVADGFYFTPRLRQDLDLYLSIMQKLSAHRVSFIPKRMEGN